MSDRLSTYVRIPHAITRDPRFEMVFDNDAALAWWLRMLLQADAAWPSPAPMPRAPKRAVSILVDAGLIEPRPHGSFAIPGMDTDRIRRVEAGKIGGHASAESRAGQRSGNEPFNDAATNRSTNVQPTQTHTQKQTNTTGRDPGGSPVDLPVSVEPPAPVPPSFEDATELRRGKSGWAPWSPEAAKAKQDAERQAGSLRKGTRLRAPDGPAEKRAPDGTAYFEVVPT